MRKHDEKRCVGARGTRPAKGVPAIVVVVLLCGTLALAAAEKKKKTVLTKPPAVTTDPGHTVPGAGLPTTIKIDPDHLPVKISSQCKAFSPAVRKAWEDVIKNFQSLSQRVADYEADYEAACAECRNKSYSQQEMEAAGCLPTDTLAQCSQKLFNKCISSISRLAGHLLLCMDIQGLSKASQKLEEDFFQSK